MDSQPADSGLRLGAGSALSHPRQGCLLRQHICAPSSIAWHSRSSHICTLALAERVCRAADRFDPAGMPGPYCGDKRAAPSPHPCVLHGLLQCSANSSLVRQGCTQWKGRPASGACRRTAYAWWTSPSVRSDLICGRDRLFENIQQALADSVGAKRGLGNERRHGLSGLRDFYHSRFCDAPESAGFTVAELGQPKCDICDCCAGSENQR
jgi:hypothetical protein